MKIYIDLHKCILPELTGEIQFVIQKSEISVYSKNKSVCNTNS